VNQDELIEQYKRREYLKRMFSLDQFRTAVQAGAFRLIVLRGAGAFFEVEAYTEAGERARAENKLKRRGRRQKKFAYEWDDDPSEEIMTLATSRSKYPRRFRSANAALEVLWRIGVRNVDLRLEAWHPDKAEYLTDVRRPDMAERLKRAHETARSEAVARQALEPWSDAG
jgi:hypothetical protein